MHERRKNKSVAVVLAKEVFNAIASVVLAGISVCVYGTIIYGMVVLVTGK